MTSQLALDVFVVPYKPIVPFVPPMSPGEPTWPATSNSLISGERDAVLVDTPLTADNAEKVVAWIQSKGKNLTTIYITHGHGDHFFGLSTILAAFPSARAVTAPAIVPMAQGQLSPAAMGFWNAILPGEIPDEPNVPAPLDGDVIELEGHELRIIAAAQADTAPTTIVHIPELDAVVAGDIVYNGIHQFMAETDHERRLGWLASIDQVEALEPKRLVAGHMAPGSGIDDPAGMCAATRTYIRDFERCLTEASSAQQLVDEMLALHGDLGNVHTLWASAAAAFAPAPVTES